MGPGRSCWNGTKSALQPGEIFRRGLEFHVCTINKSAHKKRFGNFFNDSRIYIYIYIYSHPQTDCFVVSQLFSVARHVGRLKLGSKPTQLYVRLSILPLSQQANHVSSGIIRH